MDQKEQISELVKALHRTLDYFRKEFQISYGAAIGAAAIFEDDLKRELNEREN